MNIESFMKKIRQINPLQTVLYIFGFIGIVAFIFLPYILKFGGSGFSNSTTVWAEYGSYISGTTSFLNLLVFISLTIYVAQLGSSDSKKQLDFQKKIFLSQFRQSEFLNISEIINKPYKISNASSVEELYLSYRLLWENAYGFFDKYITLFPNISSEVNKDIILDYSDAIEEFIQFMKPIRGKLFKDLSEEQILKLNYYMDSILPLKLTILEILQKFIIDDLMNNN